jgi:hypothetical protein
MPQNQRFHGSEAGSRCSPLPHKENRQKCEICEIREPPINNRAPGRRAERANRGVEQNPAGPFFRPYAR